MPTLPPKRERVGEFGYGSRPVRCLPSWGTGRSSGSSVQIPNTHPRRIVRRAATDSHSFFFCPRIKFLRVEGEVFGVSRGFPLPRAVSELRSPGAACSTISPPAVPYTVSPVSTVHQKDLYPVIVRIEKDEPRIPSVKCRSKKRLVGVHFPRLNSFQNFEAGRDSQPPRFLWCHFIFTY